MSKKVKLQAIAQIVPNKAGIEAPSRLEEAYLVSQDEFNLDYADNSKIGKVSFAEDGVSNPQQTTTYTGWYKAKGRVIVK